MNDTETFDLQEYLEEQMAHGDWLALQARAAALAGDHERAEAIRDEYDRLYDRLEAMLPEVTPCQPA